MIEEEEDAVVEVVEEVLTPEQVAADEERYRLAVGKINALVDECAKGRSDREAEARAIGEEFELEDYVKREFAKARANRITRRFGGGASFSRSETQPQVVVQPKSVPEPAESKAAVPDWAKADWDEPVEKPESKEFADAVEADLGVRFDASDLAKEGAEPLTIEARNAAFERLADLRKSDPFEAAKERKRLAKELSCPVGLVDDTVDAIIKERNGGDDENQNQATQLVAIGSDKDCTRLWCAEGEGEEYVSVLVKGHWENHRIESTTFEQWLRYVYGQQYQVKIGGEWRPKVAGDGAVKNAMEQLKGIAKFTGTTGVPARRVGGDGETIWIDLGGPDWRGVKVTAQGWDIVTTPSVAFLRTSKVKALPMPVRGGRIEDLRPLINVPERDFVLVPGWGLQALNPVGPYPIGNMHGLSENGKTSLQKILAWLADPNATSIRRFSKPDDVLIACRNNWVIGFDNLSKMTVDMSDILCMVSTGASTGTRTHYTNDEEFSYSFEQPVLFNGIEEELVSRGDLASRTIRFGLQPITNRRRKKDIEAEFLRVWPSVFGALLDGLVGALRDQDTINVKTDHGTEPARLMDFEQFAEAGCRAMGFGKWEFVNAYAINRRELMANALERSIVGRAVWKFMKEHPNGFAGKHSDLLPLLDRCRDNWGYPAPNDWPKTPGKLSDALSRLVQPLAAVAIDCRLQQDRRKEGGSQFDVVLMHRAK